MQQFKGVYFMEIELSIDDIEIIKKLKKEKQYQKIYELYGKDIYANKTPLIYQMKDMYKLFKEKKFIDIQVKYGDLANFYLLPSFLYNDVLFNSNNKIKSYIFKNIMIIKNFFKYIIYLSSIYFLAIITSLPMLSLMEIEKNKQIYEEEIDNYEENLNEYISSLNLEGKTDLEIIMMLINDMWESIEGYKKPEIDAVGYERLDINNGFGVCRNMADDIAAKLNAINPKYNARKLVVESNFIDYEFADVNIKVVPEEPNEEVLEKTENKESLVDQVMDQVIGNHMVILVDIPDKNITLVVDPTNVGIGILKNGRITMFNGLESTYEIKETNNILFYGYLEYFKLLCDEFKSVIPQESIEELNKEYGIDAQNKALEKVK